MLKKLYLIVIICTCMLFRINPQENPESWSYIFPYQNCTNLPVKTDIILKSNKKLEKKYNLGEISVFVKGEKSGLHLGRMILSDDNFTVIFKPYNEFITGEKVFVKINSGEKYSGGLQYTFTIAEHSYSGPAVWNNNLDNPRFAKSSASKDTYGTVTVINGVAVPSDFPRMNIAISKETDKGKIFIANWGGTAYMMILENDGTPYFYKRLSGYDQVRDFKVQPTGTLTMRMYGNLNCFVEMDSQYTIIDTLRCGGGYGTDEHECQLMPDHHCFLIGLDYRHVDMSKLVSGGNQNATVIGNTVQELDKNHNVIFQWRSWDNFDITDAVHENLKGATIDYVHMNSIAVDYDSNIVISSRHLSEVTKINRKTGKIIWRLGGKHNDFTFVNDPYGFSYQHDARPVPGKPDHYTIFDDGNFHSPQFSRVVEYKIDTLAKTATLVWQYRHNPDYYTFYMGNAQRLPNGNTFIDWSDSPLPKAYEVTPAGETVYSANFSQNMPCYRAFRFDWESNIKIPYLLVESYPDRVTLIFNKFGDKNVERYIIYGGLSPHPITPLDSTNNTWIDLKNLTNNKNYYFRITARDSNGVESQFSNEVSALVHYIRAGDNLIYNGDFSSGTYDWKFGLSNGGDAVGSIKNQGEFAVFIKNGGTQRSSIQLYQSGIALVYGKQYIFEFDAYATKTRTIDARIEQNGGSYSNYSRTSTTAIGTEKSHKSFQFTMNNPSDADSKVTFNLGLSVDTVYIDNVSLKEVAVNSVDKKVTPQGEFELDQNYPNPFNPITTIGFRIPSAGAAYRTTLEIFNLLGQKVATLVNEDKTQGTYSVKWNAAAFPSGIYYCKLKAQCYADNRVYMAVRKIILLK